MAGLRIERDGHVLRVTLARPERRNAFDAELIGWRSAAEKDLGASPVLCFRGKIEGEHLAPTRGAVAIRASLKQGTQILFLTQSSGEHKNGNAAIVF